MDEFWLREEQSATLVPHLRSGIRCPKPRQHLGFASSSSMRFSLIPLLLIAGLIPSGAWPSEIALDLSPSRPATLITLNGEIRKDLFRIEELVAEAQMKRPGMPIVLTLNSRGGNHFEGMVIGLFLKKNGIGTVVTAGASCESACASIFLGGFNKKTGKPDRTVYQGGRLGVHRWRRTDGREPSLRDQDRVAGGAGWYLDQVNISPNVQTKLFETPPTSMYYLTADDMTGSGIVFKFTSSAPNSNADSTSAMSQPNIQNDPGFVKARPEAETVPSNSKEPDPKPKPETRIATDEEITAILGTRAWPPKARPGTQAPMQ